MSRALLWSINRCVRTSEGIASIGEDNMRIRIHPPTYKLVYEAGSEDFIWHDWDNDEEMIVRARLRDEERRRSHWIKRQM